MKSYSAAFTIKWKVDKWKDMISFSLPVETDRNRCFQGDQIKLYATLSSPVWTIFITGPNADNVVPEFD